MKKWEFKEAIYQSSNEARLQFPVCNGWFERAEKIVTYGRKHGLFESSSISSVDGGNSVFKLLSKLCELPKNYRITLDEFMTLEIEIERAWDYFQKHHMDREMEVVLREGVPVCGSCENPVHLNDKKCSGKDCKAIPIWKAQAIQAWYEKYSPIIPEAGVYTGSNIPGI